MNTLLENEYVTYEQLDNGIHRIELRDNARTSVDAYLQIVDKVISDAIEEQVDLVRMMIVISSDQMPSLQYLANGAKKVLARHPNRPNFRNVYVFRHNFMANLLQMFIKMIVQRSSDKMNFFPMKNLDEAMVWLLEDA